MAFAYLALLILMMLFGGMLIEHNQQPLVYTIALFGNSWRVRGSLLELIGWSMMAGGGFMALPYLRYVWISSRERRQLAKQTDALRDDNQSLRRDTETIRTEVKLLEARAAEAEERAATLADEYARLEAETRPLLTMKQDAANGQAEIKPTVPSRWRRR